MSDLTKIQKRKSHEDFKKEALENPEVREEYERLLAYDLMMRMGFRILEPETDEDQWRVLIQNPRGYREVLSRSKFIEKAMADAAEKIHEYFRMAERFNRIKGALFDDNE